MRMKNLYKKPITTTLHYNIWSRYCSMSVVIIWSLLILGCIFLLHLYSNNTSLNMIHPLHSSSYFNQLQQVENEKFQIPPPNKKRLPQSKSITPLVDEFLDKDSTLRHVFFPHKTNAIDPMKTIGKEINDSYSYYYPGRVWLDTDGNPIQAHGGCILYDEISSTYYWYGEYKDGPTYLAHGNKGPARVDIIGVGCYSSKDLWTWKKEGIVLTAGKTNKAHDLHKSNVLERPKVIYNEKTRKYVMLMHIDDANYAKASIGVAVSDTPIGPFKYLGSQRPHGYQSRDMTVYKDEDSVAYLIYSSEENNVMHIGPLTDDYLNVTSVMRRIFVGQRREAPAMFKHKGIYYMITSGCTGWAPNEALVHASDSILGTWETIGNPCVGGNKMFRVSTFLAQSTFVVPLNKFPGLFIFMADRWNPGELRDSRYVWLPLIVDGNDDQTLEYGFGYTLWPRVSIYWHRKWKLPLGWNTLK